MIVAAIPEVPPLHEDADGAMRIGNSRVLLELVIRAFQNGATPENIVQGYPTASLADVYSVIAYYLRHREDVEQYLAIRERQAAEIKTKIEAKQGPMTGIRQRLLARRRS